MDRRSLLCMALGSLLVGTWTAASARGATESEACASASEQGQLDKLNGKWVAARERFALCARSTCPAVVRDDCSTWLMEAEKQVPTVVLSARDPSGADLAETTVRVDGVVVRERLDGTPIVLDPGPHVFRFEHRGRPPVERRIIVEQGVKNALVSVVLQPGADPAPSSPNPPAPSRSVVPYVLGGVGVVALGSFVAFAIRANNGYRSLEQTCAPTCPSERIDAVRRDATIADVSLALSAAALGAAAITFFWLPEGHRGTHASAMPIAHGGALLVSGEF